MTTSIDPKLVKLASSGSFGDWRFAGTYVLERSQLTGSWSDRFSRLEKTADLNPVLSLPRQHLQQTLRSMDPGSTPAFADTGPLYAPTAFSARFIGWLAPPGHREHEPDHLTRARPLEAIEALFARDSKSGRIGGWWSTRTGELAPMPTGLPYDPSLSEMVRLLRTVHGIDTSASYFALQKTLDTLAPGRLMTMPASRLNDLLRHTWPA